MGINMETIEFIGWLNSLAVKSACFIAFSDCTSKEMFESYIVYDDMTKDIRVSGENSVESFKLVSPESSWGEMQPIFYNSNARVVKVRMDGVESFYVSVIQDNKEIVVKNGTWYVVGGRY